METFPFTHPSRWRIGVCIYGRAAFIHLPFCLALAASQTRLLRSRAVMEIDISNLRTYTSAQCTEYCLGDDNKMHIFSATPTGAPSVGKCIILILHCIWSEINKTSAGLNVRRTLLKRVAEKKVARKEKDNKVSVFIYTAACSFISSNIHSAFSIHSGSIYHMKEVHQNGTKFNYYVIQIFLYVYSVECENVYFPLCVFEIEEWRAVFVELDELSESGILRLISIANCALPILDQAAKIVAYYSI